MLSDVCRFQVSEQGPSCRRFGARLDLRHMLSVGHSGNMLSFRLTLYYGNVADDGNLTSFGRPNYYGVADTIGI